MKTLNFFKLLVIMMISHIAHGQKEVSLFNKEVDVGQVKHQGSTTYNSDEQSYTLNGAGANIWFKEDQFHFANKKVKGNFILRATAGFIGEGVDPHRKLGWMVRTGLETDDAMVCATVHGDGLTAIQFRKAKGMDVEEVKSPIVNPDIIQLERRGSSFVLSVANYGKPFWSTKVEGFSWADELLGGLFICSHNADVVEQGKFTNVRIVFPAPDDLVPYREYIGSHLEVMEVETGHRKILFSVKNSIQAPNWTPDNNYLIYNSEGLIYKFDLKTNQPALMPTGTIQNNNNDHVLSFDGNSVGLSSASGEKEYGSLIYTVPITGGIPKRVTPIGPSYLHGWSPDGKWLTYTAGRNGAFNIFKTQSDGKGEEIQLTDEPSLDDGSEYSPDGQHIFFNSARTGSMELWKMNTDGSKQTQLTNDKFQNWFPHVSPDGKSIVFLSYLPDVNANDHPFYKHVYLRKIPISGGEPKVIAYLYGGQGTINVPSWSPDGKYIAFVSNSIVD